MRDIMIDIETMGRKPGCPVISIGAVLFNRNSGDFGAEFEIEFDFNSALDAGIVDSDTVKWWLQQSADARARLISGNIDFGTGLRRFYNWLDAQGVEDMCVWGNGATFDITILESAFESEGMEPPWKFWGIRDCRTVEDLSPVTRKAFKRGGTHHSALDDAKYQAKYISGMIQAIKGRDSARYN